MMNANMVAPAEWTAWIQEHPVKHLESRSAIFSLSAEWRTKAGISLTGLCSAVYWASENRIAWRQVGNQHANINDLLQVVEEWKSQRAVVDGDEEGDTK